MICNQLEKSDSAMALNQENKILFNPSHSSFFQYVKAKLKK